MPRMQHPAKVSGVRSVLAMAGGVQVGKVKSFLHLHQGQAAPRRSPPPRCRACKCGLDSRQHPPCFGKARRIHRQRVIQILYRFAVRSRQAREAEGVHVRAYGCQLCGPAFHRATARVIIMAEDANTFSGNIGKASA